MPNPSDQSEQSQSEVNVETDSQSFASASPADGPLPADGSALEDDTPVVSSGNDQIDELTADLKRIQAEFLNYKRRAEAERADVIDFAKTRVIREFLVVRDSFDQEQMHRPAAVDPQWAATIDAIRTQFDQVLASLGVERFVSQGQPFDPHQHEAVATEGEGDTVVEELQPGYKLGATILRHAVVKVGGQGDAPAA